MPALDLEAEYRAGLRVPAFLEIMARWQAASAAVRRTARTELDQPYGPGERQRYDLFHAGAGPAPLVVFIHGGYWRMGERQDCEFIADVRGSVPYKRELMKVYVRRAIREALDGGTH
jgi:arylformamidase